MSGFHSCLFFIFTLASTNALPFFGGNGGGGGGGGLLQAFAGLGQALGGPNKAPGATPVFQSINRGAGVVKQMGNDPFAATQGALNMIPGASNVVNPLFQTIQRVAQIKPIQQAIQPGLDVIGGGMKTGANAINTHVLGNLEKVGLASGGLALGAGAAKQQQQGNRPQQQQPQQQQQQPTADYSEVNQKWISLDDYVKIYYISRLSQKDYKDLLSILTPANRNYLQALEKKVKGMPIKEQQDYVKEGYRRFSNLTGGNSVADSPPPPTVSKTAPVANKPSTAPKTAPVANKPPTAAVSKPSPSPSPPVTPRPPPQKPSPATKPSTPPTMQSMTMDNKPSSTSTGPTGMGSTMQSWTMDNKPSSASTEPTGMGSWNEGGDMFMGDGVNDFQSSSEKNEESDSEMDTEDIPMSSNWKSSNKSKNVPNFGDGLNWEDVNLL